MPLSLSILLVFLASWIVLPAPNRPLLALAVGAPEVSAWLLAAALVLLGFTFAIDGAPALNGPPKGGHYVRWVAIVAAVLAALPLVRIPSVTRRFDAAMREGLGDDFLRRVPAEYRERMRPRPVDPVTLFAGIRAGNARVTRGIEFAAPEGVRLTLDVYRPAADGEYPTVVQIYGGAWQRGAPADDATPARYLASHGFVVIAIDYRHAPRWQWPAQIEDVRSALGWIRDHGREHGADPARIALLGRSAGAQLAMVAAYESPTSAVRAVVSYYGPVDLADGYRNPPQPDPIDVRAIEEAFLGGTPDSRPERYRDASPISYVDSALPPSLLIYGSRDHVVLPRFGAMLHQRLRAAGAASVFLEIPWAEHAFDAIANGPSGQLSLYYTERFLAWALASR